MSSKKIDSSTVHAIVYSLRKQCRSDVNGKYCFAISTDYCLLFMSPLVGCNLMVLRLWGSHAVSLCTLVGKNTNTSLNAYNCCCG